MIALSTLFAKQCQREWLIQVRQPRVLVQGTLFFIMVTLFFPLTLPAQTTLLPKIAPGLVWIAALLAFLLTSVGLFQRDYEDGIIEQWLLSGYSLSTIIAAKLSVHWLLNLLPMLIFCPILSLVFHLSAPITLTLLLSLVLGTPALLFLCGLAAAFSASMQQKGVFMALLLFPLTVPLLVFGSGSVTMMMQGFPTLGYLLLLFAFSILTVAFLPWAIAGVIRLTLVD